MSTSFDPLAGCRRSAAAADRLTLLEIGDKAAKCTFRSKIDHFLSSKKTCDLRQK
jgi:hypothetical protein